MFDVPEISDALFTRVGSAAVFRLIAQTDTGLQHALIATTENGQGTVGRYAFQRFIVFEIVAELGAFFFFAGHATAAQDAVIPQQFAQLAKQFSVFAEAFHQDMARTFQGGFDVGHAFVSIHISASFCFRVFFRCAKQQVSQWLQTGFAGDLCLGAAFGFVGQVQVFQTGFGIGGADVLFQFWGQFVLLGNAFKNGFATLF